MVVTKNAKSYKRIPENISFLQMGILYMYVNDR